jgi:DNA-directed RNA polymerase specialized sigma24 family protein
LLLRYAQGLPVKNIAEVLGVKQNAVSVRINRALKEIRKFIKYEENN